MRLGPVRDWALTSSFLDLACHPAAPGSPASGHVLEAQAWTMPRAAGQGKQEAVLSCCYAQYGYELFVVVCVALCLSSF